MLSFTWLHLSEITGWKGKNKNPRMIKILDTYAGILPIFGDLYTLPETNIAPENGWLEDEFPFGMAQFQELC